MDEMQRRDADNAIFGLLAHPQPPYTGDGSEQHAATGAAADAASLQRSPSPTLPRREALARYQHDQPPQTVTGNMARLLALGVGGGGSNAINRMIEARTSGVEFIAVNTDAQALGQSLARQRLHIGEALTRGMGAGGDPTVGRQAAEESYAAIVEAVTGAEMVFITAGMGGGTGTGASPLVAQAAREVGALTVAIVTTPFAFERRRKQIAEQGLAALRDVVDALIVVPNERLMQLVAQDTSVFAAYRMADDVVRLGVEGISDLITIPGLINLDFADIRAVMADAGSAYMSMGMASGEDRVEAAVRMALDNPLLDVDISGAHGLIFNISGGDDLTLREVGRIAELLGAAVAPDANLIFGTVRDPQAAGALKLTVVATGFEPRVLHNHQVWGGPRGATVAAPVSTHISTNGTQVNRTARTPQSSQSSSQSARTGQSAPSGQELRVERVYAPYMLEDMDDEPPGTSAQSSQFNSSRPSGQSYRATPRQVTAQSSPVARSQSTGAAHPIHQDAQRQGAPSSRSRVLNSQPTPLESRVY
ncbi:MAG: cell division protein FtsZ, partial [Ktedonobacterales bacterium]